MRIFYGGYEMEPMDILQFEIMRNIRQEIDYKRRLSSLPKGRDLRKPSVKVKIIQENGKKT